MDNKQPHPQEEPIQVVPLGAGQHVGKSCIIVTLGGKTIMFDCGMHMGFQDHRRFPDFSLLKQPGQRGFTDCVDLVIISHFHLDHCGALPHFTEQAGYDGPILMTHPTRAIVPILLEDYRKITVETQRKQHFFTSAQIQRCLEKVHCVNLKETVTLGPDFEVTAYYAGHVLGAAMFHVRVGTQSVLYTGDFNMTPDRHLGPAVVPRLRPDVVITESTYGTFTRASKRQREQDFILKIAQCVQRGGRVLVPVFALGRAQELCLLLESFWAAMPELHKVGLFVAPGLATKAMLYYRLFLDWTTEDVKKQLLDTNVNVFDFQHIRVFDKTLLKAHQGAMVVLATPGMLHAGLSLEIFKHWAEDVKNLVVLPGYCVAGTVGNQILSGRKQVVIDGQTVPVRCEVANLSFSAHADAVGIMKLIENVNARSVVLVHGEKRKMSVLSRQISNTFQIPVHFPANGETIRIQPQTWKPVHLSLKLLQQSSSIDPELKQPLNQRQADQRGLISVDSLLVQNHTNTRQRPILATLAEIPLLTRAKPHVFSCSSSVLLTSDSALLQKYDLHQPAGNLQQRTLEALLAGLLQPYGFQPNPDSSWTNCSSATVRVQVVSSTPYNLDLGVGDDQQGEVHIQLIWELPDYTLATTVETALQQ
jgi:integrator complex subunit 11